MFNNVKIDAAPHREAYYTHNKAEKSRQDNTNTLTNGRNPILIIFSFTDRETKTYGNPMVSVDGGFLVILEELCNVLNKKTRFSRDRKMLENKIQ